MRYTYNIAYTIDIEADSADEAWMKMRKLFPADAENKDYDFIGSNEHDLFDEADRRYDETH